MERKLLLILLSVGLFFSCKSTEDPTLFESSNLPGMIYDGDNRPVERVLLTTMKVTEKGEEKLHIVETDINGRFTLPNLNRGDYKIIARKEGYESLTTEISYSSRTEVLYLKMYSQKQILDLAANALEQGRLAKTEKLIERSAGINKMQPGHLYFKAMYFYRKGDFKAALKPLDQILAAGYDFPWVYLLQGDIYQYHLKKNDKALEALRKFSNSVEDGDVRVRIKELEVQ